jgi:hypothetical protein
MWDHELVKKVKKDMSAVGGLAKVGEWRVLEGGECGVASQSFLRLLAFWQVSSETV